ncbi:MAG: PIN domain-containing protein [Gordonia sp. (in: high G+C Gram-positive bacteria)]
MQSRVLVDANVWYSRTLTDWVSKLSAFSGMYTVLWTEDVLAEARYHLRKDKPDVGDGPLTTRFDRIRDLFPEGRVSGYEITDKEHPDRHDWHVVSAAISAKADYLLTSDKKFMDLQNHSAVDTWCFEVHNPDTFFDLVHESSSQLVKAVTRDEFNYWILGRRSDRSLSDMLHRAGAPEFAQRVGEYVRELSR